MEQKKKYDVLDVVGLIFGIITMVIAVGFIGYIIFNAFASDSDGMLGMVIILALIFALLLCVPFIMFGIIGVLEVIKYKRITNNKPNKQFCTSQIILLIIATIASLIFYGWVSFLIIVPSFICVLFAIIRVKSVNKNDANAIEASKADVVEQSDMLNVQYCVNCGAKVNKENNFCAQCGKQIKK